MFGDTIGTSGIIACESRLAKTPAQASFGRGTRLRPIEPCGSLMGNRVQQRSAGVVEAMLFPMGFELPLSLSLAFADLALSSSVN